jgi:hypothetical protein
MSTIRKQYEKDFLRIEFVISVIIGIAIWLLVDNVVTRPSFNDFLIGTRQAIYSAVASTAGSLLGFVLATISIVMIFGESPRLGLLRTSKQYETVYSVFFQAVSWLGFATLWAFVGLVCDTDQRPHSEIALVMIFLVILVIFRVARCVWILKSITSLATSQNGAGG